MWNQRGKYKIAPDIFTLLIEIVMYHGNAWICWHIDHAISNRL